MTIGWVNRDQADGVQVAVNLTEKNFVHENTGNMVLRMFMYTDTQNIYQIIFSRWLFIKIEILWEQCYFSLMHDWCNARNSLLNV